jgi:hypothetical protein
VLTADVITVLAIVIVAFAALRWAEHRWGHRLGEPGPVRYEERIAELEREIERQREQHEQRVKEMESEIEKQREQHEQRARELERRIDFLVGELQRAGIHIRDLEKTLAETSRAKAAPPAAVELPAKPLLLICGSDERFCETDRQALRQARILFQRLSSATTAMIAAELRRRRQDGTLYPWLHVSAHADHAGIHLADGVAGPDWWHEQLNGVQVVFLAACETTTVADALAGMVTVVFVQQQIENEHAGDFTYAFWRRMRELRDPRVAYRQALAEVPQVTEYVDIRSS